LRHFLLRIVFIVVLIQLMGSVSARAKEEITMALIPLQSPSAMYKRFLPLKRYLEEKLNVKIRIKVARKSKEIITSLKDGSADIAFLCPTLYTVAYKEASVQPVVKLRVNGKSEYRSALLVRDDSSVKKTADLLDGSFVYGRYACPGSGLLPEIMLKRIGLTEETLFDVAKLGSDESAITAVLARMFDATGVPEMVARPYLGKGLRILRYSYSIPQYLFVARTSLGTEFIDEIKQAMLSINKIKNRRAIVGSIESGVDGFDEATDSDYDIVRILMNNISDRKDLIIPRRASSIRLYVEPVFFEPEIFATLNPLVTYLLKHGAIQFQIIVPQNIGDFLSAQESVKGAFFLENRILADTYSKKRGLEGVTTVSIKDFSDPGAGLVLVQSEGSIRSLDDLQGKRVGITSTYSEGGYLAQKRILNSEGISPDTIRFIELGTYENVVMHLYRGRIDAAFVSQAALDSMKDDIDMKRIRILAKTPSLNTWVLMAQEDINDEVIEKVRNLIKEYTGMKTEPLP